MHSVVYIVAPHLTSILSRVLYLTATTDFEKRIQGWAAKTLRNILNYSTPYSSFSGALGVDIHSINSVTIKSLVDNIVRQIESAGETPFPVRMLSQRCLPLVGDPVALPLVEALIVAPPGEEPHQKLDASFIHKLLGNRQYFHSIPLSSRVQFMQRYYEAFDFEVILFMLGYETNHTPDGSNACCVGGKTFHY